MKLLLAIINNDDSHEVSSELSSKGFYVTKISSTGGFLMSGNSTFLIGVDDGDVDRVIELMGQHCKKRTQTVPMDMRYQQGKSGNPVGTVIVGGATVFVLNVEECRHL